TPCGGTKVSKGIVLKGTFEETDEFVSIVGSTTFKDIPKSILEAYTPVVYTKQPKVNPSKKIKTVKDNETKKTKKTK
ncbi:hypothetical protein, partial [Streptomyces brasiliscabiei]|uniref:hypothetical protein n=1 Tax=Streptomyces brasiliscabiei TaxID=2736302 RepID=UPI0030149CE2